MFGAVMSIRAPSDCRARLAQAGAALPVLSGPAGGTPFDEDQLQPKKPRRFAGLRASFLTGIVVIAPVGLTIWFIWALMGWVDNVVLPLVPSQLRPEQYIVINLRGVAVIIFLIITIIVGWVAKGLIGKTLIGFGESLVERTPVVRTI